LASKKEVIFKPESGRIDFQVRFGAAIHACPTCGAVAQPRHDRLARSWRPLGPAAADSNLSSASAGRSPTLFLAYSTGSRRTNTTAGVEAMNRALQEVRARARGYRRVENFIAMAYPIAGKLSNLPASPFATFLPVPLETN